MAGELEAAFLVADMFGGGVGGSPAPLNADQQEAFSYTEGGNVSVSIGGLNIPDRSHDSNSPAPFLSSFNGGSGYKSPTTLNDNNNTLIMTIGVGVVVALVSGLIVAKIKQ